MLIFDIYSKLSTKVLELSEQREVREADHVKLRVFFPNL
jgi:hypothetical protein